MKPTQRIILESPLAIPDILEVYRRIVLALPDTVELFHIAILDAQNLYSMSGKSTSTSINEYLDLLNDDVIKEYSELTNVPYSNVRTLFENDVVTFVNLSSIFYKCQLRFHELTKYLRQHAMFLMVDNVVASDTITPYVVAVSKELSYVQLPKCNYPDSISPDGYF